MAGFLRSGVVVCALLLGGLAPLAAQDKGPPPPPAQPEKVEKIEPAAGPPAKFERDGSSSFVYYLLAALAVAAILLAICLPIRRE